MASEPILLVDDNPSNLKLVRILLELGNYEIQSARDAKDTFRILKTYHPKLILMDIQLPGMNGLEITRKIRKDHKFDDVVIIAITAYAMRTDEERALEAGCDGYISKPIDTRTLVDVIAKYLHTGRKK